MKQLLFPPKFIIIFFSFLISKSSFSDIPYFYIKPQFQQFNSTSFNQFLSSYGEVNKSLLKDNSLTKKLGTGLSLGLGLAYDNRFMSSFEYSRSSSIYTFDYTNGANRRFKYKNNHIMFNFGVGIGTRLSNEDEEELILFVPEFGIGIGNSRIVSSFDQGSSYLELKYIEGTYKTFNGQINAGLSFIYSKKIFGVKASAKYNSSMFPTTLINKSKETGKDRLYLDVKNYNTKTIGDAVENDLKYWQFSVGLFININQIFE